MTIRALRIRFAAVAAALLVFTLTAAQAQICDPAPCACGNATISIDRHLPCGIVLCDITSPTCTTFLPGDHVVTCAQLNRFRLRDCHGVMRCLPKLNECIRCVCARTGCCVDICLTSSVAECLILQVTPSICTGC